MPVPELSLSSADPLSIEGDVLVLGVRKTDDGPRLAPQVAGLESLQAALGSIGVTGGLDEVRRVPSDLAAAGGIALVGLGGGTTTVHDLRYAAGSAARQLRGVGTLVLALPADDDAETLAVLEGAALGAYAFETYRSTVDADRVPATAVVVVSPVDDAALIERAAAVADAVHTVRDLVNTPPNDLYPETFAERAGQLAEGTGVAIEVLAEDELRAGGFGGILGVGQGSSRGPRLVKAVWAPEGAAAHLALVGKGITFDSGGLSLKPPASMIGMKYDMTGAATVLAVALAAARLRLPVAVTAWLCLAENLPSGTAIRPNDVLRIRDGKTVEVLNTDAEGRLVLADGLAAASEEHPDAIVDVATLTGAASVALGTRTTGVMGDTALVRRVVEAGDSVGETLWPMPLGPELRPLLASDVADIANVKPNNTAGGMLLAGAFLRDFVGAGADGAPIPWAHLDIAGAANNGAAGWGFTGKGPTGVAVRALIELADDLARG